MFIKIICQGENPVMNNNTPGDRVRLLRNRFNLTQQAFSEAVGMTHGNVSKIEKNEVAPSNTFLKAINMRFACNPDWVRTGEGEMLIAPEDYIANGIEFLGVSKFGEGLARILNDPQFAELQSVVAVREMVKERLDPDLTEYLQYIVNIWRQGDEKVRGWLMIQLEIAFQEVAARLRERRKG